MNLTGSIVAIATPFRGGKIDEAAFRKLIDFQIDGGTAAIIPCGTTGESATMTHEEHESLVRLTIEHVAGRVPVVAGTGSNSTAEALRLSRSAKEAGAQGALLITPYYNKPTQEGLYAHYAKIADEVDLPLIVYNCPGRTSVSINPDTIKRLAKHKNIWGVKDATGNLDWTTEVCQIEGITVLSGDDSLAVPQISIGAKGVISVLANIAPRPTADMMAKALAGDFAGARAIHHKYFKLIKTLFIETSPMPVKAALEMMGLTGGEIRLPLVGMSDAGRSKLKDALKEVGILK